VRPVSTARTRILRWDPYLEPNEDDMEFRLTYEGALYAHQQERKVLNRNVHVHSLRKRFHKQLKELRRCHPILSSLDAAPPAYHLPPHPPVRQIFTEEGFRWLPIVNEANGLICKLDVLMLRPGAPGLVQTDLDNRLKTVFDALSKPNGPHQLITDKSGTKLSPEADEDPFCVLLQDDKLITHTSVTADTLLEDVITNPPTPRENAVRLILTVTVRPYFPFSETVGQQEIMTDGEIRMEWQPIETAPKDVEVLVYSSDKGITVARYDYGFWGAQLGGRTVYDQYEVPEFVKATHWMPLPAPPIS